MSKSLGFPGFRPAVLVLATLAAGCTGTTTAIVPQSPAPPAAVTDDLAFAIFQVIAASGPVVEVDSTPIAYNSDMQGRECRVYRFRENAAGAIRLGRATVCRNPDGAWVVTSRLLESPGTPPNPTVPGGTNWQPVVR